MAPVSSNTEITAAAWKNRFTRGRINFSLFPEIVILSPMNIPEGGYYINVTVLLHATICAMKLS
jgi:hypothetical protein